MLAFNWGMFWALLAAFVSRGIWRALSKIIARGKKKEGQGQTLLRRE
jgi:hypothetical protein